MVIRAYGVHEMARYTKTQGHHCWWLNKDGKALTNFDNEKDVDDIIRLEETLELVKQRDVEQYKESGKFGIDRLGRQSIQYALNV